MEPSKVERRSNYDRKKKSYSRLSVVTPFQIQPEKKNVEKIFTTGRKKVLVTCLAGARSLLQPDKKSSSRLSGGCAIVITTGKKSSSRLYGGCAIVITIEKINILVVCLAGA